MINNIKELAAHFCAYCDTEASIQKRLFKDTECGVSCGVDDKCFWVAGYCEGSDWEHETYRLEFPFTEEAIDKAIEKADQDGCETWNQTHGCEKCHPDGSCDQWGNTFAPGEVGGPIDPNCKECGGHGSIL